VARDFAGRIRWGGKEERITTLARGQGNKRFGKRGGETSWFLPLLSIRKKKVDASAARGQGGKKKFLLRPDRRQRTGKREGAAVSAGIDEEKWDSTRRFLIHHEKGRREKKRGQSLLAHMDGVQA